MTIRILLADDHVIVRQGFKSMLERDGFAVVSEAGDGREAVRRARVHRPHVAVLDLAMPILNGIDAAQQIARVSPQTRCILVTMHDDRQYVLAALRAGITGYILKTRAVEDLEQAIREVHKGGTYLSSGMSRDLISALMSNGELPAESLTPRERQVLQLVAEGNTTKMIASILGIAVKTAESHRNRVMAKLDIHETASLVRYAIRHGLVQP